MRPLLVLASLFLAGCVIPSWADRYWAPDDDDSAPVDDDDSAPDDDDDVAPNDDDVAPDDDDAAPDDDDAAPDDDDVAPDDDDTTFGDDDDDDSVPTTQCNDQFDNDADGFVDLADSDCASGSDPLEGLCSNTCTYAFDAVCDDGGVASQYSICVFGTDCSDCGIRSSCANTCSHAFDGICDDGGTGASSLICDEGTDCADCGPRP